MSGVPGRQEAVQIIFLKHKSSIKRKTVEIFNVKRPDLGSVVVGVHHSMSSAMNNF